MIPTKLYLTANDAKIEIMRSMLNEWLCYFESDFEFGETTKTRMGAYIQSATYYEKHFGSDPYRAKMIERVKEDLNALPI